MICPLNNAPRSVLHLLLAVTGITVLLTTCHPAPQDSAEEVTHRDESLKGDLDFSKIYINQLRFMQLYAQGADSATLRAYAVDSIFQPNKYVLGESCFGYSPASYYAAQLDLAATRGGDIDRAVAFYDKIHLDSLLAAYQHDFTRFVGYPVSGRFSFSFFERTVCNFCGCDKMSMQMDLLNPLNHDEAKLRLLVPHELSHNLFEVTQHDTLNRETVLYKAIDEGFANYVSQRMNGTTTEEAFGLDSTGYDWYLANEAAIKAKIIPILFSKDENDWDPLSEKIPNRFLEGSPGNVGYFVGYRIVEEYLKKVGEDNWRTVYTVPVPDLLAVSQWAALTLK